MRLLLVVLASCGLAPISFATTISPILLRRIDSPSDVVRFGQSVDAADLDHDGVPDIGVGGNGVRVFSGADGALLLRVDLAAEEVDFIGDTDGDGYSELVVGGVAGGLARIVSGKDGQIRPFGFQYTVSTDPGESIDGLGDVDGDGWPDFAIGGYLPPHTTLYSGSTGRSLGSVDVGHSVAGLGDVNGDGRGDFVAGRGLGIRIYSGATRQSLFQFPGDDPVLAGCDVSGDGIKDALLSMPATVGGRFAALVVSYSGANGAMIDSVTAFRDDGGAGFFRGFVTGLGDVDGDGHEDFAESFAEATYGGNAEAGAVGVFSGATGERLALVGGTAAGMHFGWSLVGPGDIDGDGVPDLIVGAPNGSDLGRVFVYRLKRGALAPRLEFLPGDCPNHVPLRGNADLELAFLGGGEFDVAEIDASTVRLAGIAPDRERPHPVDVAAIDGENCGCNGPDGDGIDDRVFRIDADAVRAQLPVGQPRDLAVTASLVDGRQVEGTVCAVVARRTNGIHLNDGVETATVQPNPIARGGTIALRSAMPQGGEPVYSIHDLRGRRVATFRAAVHDGIAEAAWDTRDARGALVPAGIYLVRFSDVPAGRILVIR
jgi:hypothetical protein